MRYTIIIIFCLIILLFPFSGFAWPTYDLNQLIGFALKSRPEISIVAQQQAEAKSISQIARSHYFPQLDLNLDYKHLDEDPYIVIPRTTINAGVDLTGVRATYPALAPLLPDNVTLPITIPTTEISVASQDVFTIRLELTQPLYTGGKITERVRQAKYLQGIAQHEGQKTNQEIIFQVKSLYYQAVFAQRAQRAISAAEKRVIVVANFLKNLYLNYIPQKGEEPITKSDYLKAKLALSKLKRVESEVEKIQQEALKSLAIACGLQERKFLVSDKVEEFKPTLPAQDAKTLKRIAYDTRQEIKQIDLSQKITASEIKLAKAGYIPNIAAFGFYQHIEDNFPTSDENVLAVGVGASVPIFNGFRTHSEIKKAKAANKRTASQKELIKLKIDLDVDQAQTTVDKTLRMIEIEKKALSQARERRSLEAEAYLLDASEYDDYLEAIEDEIIAEISFQKAMGENYLALAALQLACGFQK